MEQAIDIEAKAREELKAKYSAQLEKCIQAYNDTTSDVTGYYLKVKLELQALKGLCGENEAMLRSAKTQLLASGIIKNFPGGLQREDAAWEQLLDEVFGRDEKPKIIPPNF